MNLKKYIKYLIISIGLFLVTTISASDVPQTIEFEGSNLILNGQGTRVVFFMKVYEGSLYLENKNSDADEIMNSNAPMALRIDVTSEMVTADAMKKALSEGLEKSTNNKTGPILNEIESRKEGIKKSYSARKGDDVRDISRQVLKRHGSRSKTRKKTTPKSTTIQKKLF